MCVIVLVNEHDKRPSPSFISRAWNKNPDGGGVAWREGTGDQTVVKWKKGLTLDEMQDLLKDLPTPFVAHFRKKSIGSIESSLCHPFEVSLEASLALEGETQGFVFFHNGTWHDWDKMILNMAVQSGHMIPDGIWSDTRAMSWLSSFMGRGFLEVIRAKGIFYGPTYDYVLNGDTGWKKVDDIWVSNNEFDDIKIYNAGHNHWDHTKGNGAGYTPPQDSKKGGKIKRQYCKDTRCQVKENLDEEGYCPTHQKKKNVAPGLVESFSHTKNTLISSTDSRKGKNKPSPCQDVVNESREVARAKDPFLAQNFIDQQWALGKLSKSQWKILSKEFSLLKQKRKAREKELIQTFSQLG